MKYQYEVLREAVQQDLVQNWENFCNIRHYLHSHPEKTTAEYETARYISARLQEAGIPFRTKVGGEGIVALVEGRGNCSTIALRGDMDALEITEATGLPYASVTSGLMHACGHDFHMSAVLATGLILNRYKDMLPGNVKLLFQPAEENGPEGGAKLMIADGAMQNPKVDAVFAAHVFPSLPYGKVAVLSGTVMAAVDNFVIHINGKGGHGARPDESVDPVSIAAQIVLAFNSIIARNVSPTDNAVISIGRIEGGNRRNIIPDKVELEGTMRTLRPGTRELLKKRIYEVSSSICSSFGATAEIDWFKSYDATQNNPEMAQMARRAIRRFYGRDVIAEQTEPYMTAEDFTYFLQQTKGALILTGTDNGQSMNLHSAKLAIRDEVLMEIIKSFLAIVLEYFTGNAQKNEKE